MTDGDEADPPLNRGAAVEAVGSLREVALDRQGTESVALLELANRTLADSVDAPADVPPRDMATMDGFAFDATGGFPYEIVEAVYPEEDPPEIGPDEAVRIATGAPLPPSADAVLEREAATVEDDHLAGPPVEPGRYTYRKGTNVRAGERLFAAGERLAAKDAILLRDLGVEHVSVHERFSVGVLATGTEIHEGRSSDLDSPMLSSLVRAWGHDPAYEGTVPDEFETVVSTVADLARSHDVVLTTGGTSVGRRDYAVRALRSLGDVRFHRVAIRPGKPIAVADLPEYDAVAVAIPGKPLGAYTSATLVARPLFTGEDATPAVEATLARRVELPDPAFEYAVPVVIDGGEAMPLGHVDSPLAVYEGTIDPSVLSSSTRATRADGFVLTDVALDGGESVGVIPYGVVES